MITKIIHSLPKTFLAYGLVSIIAIGIFGLSALGLRALLDRASLVQWPWEPAVVASNIVPTTFYPVRVTSVGVPGPRWGGAGAIDSLDSQILFATRTGKFYRLSRGSLDPQRLDIPSPMVFQDFLDNFEGLKFSLTFGVKDLLLSKESGQIVAYLTHHYWKEEQGCYVLRLSRYEIPIEAFNGSEGYSASIWETLFETEPCISAEEESFPMEAGGRLSFLKEDVLLMTIGDHDFNRDINVQDTGSSYGKVWKINLKTAKSEIYSIGHRNPQGLFVTEAGIVWETEHGPKGGDELNSLSEGANFGWPIRTFGTDYNEYSWSLTDKLGYHNDYKRPFFSWSPSIGISNLLVIQGDTFPIWQGDLLVSYLKANSIFRIREREGRVVHIEQIGLGRNLRDIIELDDGAIAVLADSNAQGDGGQILILENGFENPISSTDVNSSAMDFQDQLLMRYPAVSRCIECHSFAEGSAHGLGPNLWGVLNRAIAAAPGFQYSAGLSVKGMQWTEKRLLEYLLRPAEFAPGSTMPVQVQLTDTEANSILDALRELR